MVSPMRKKRAWSTQQEDDQSEETAAFEEAVAAARDTAAASSEFLSNAKSDLTDHRRWLKAQSVAVDKDRARHERWLERQREQRVAVARKDRTRRRRQVIRQRASDATQQAAGASVSYAGSVFTRAFAKVGAGIKYVVLLIAGGFAFVGRGLRDGAFFIVDLTTASLGWIAEALKAFVFGIGRMVATAFTWSGRKAVASGRASADAMSSGSAFVSSKTLSSARAGGSVLATGSAAVSSKTLSSARAGGSAVAVGSTFVASKTLSSARASGKALSSGSTFVASKTLSAVRATGKALAAASAFVTAKTVSSTKATGSALSAGSAFVSAKVQSSARAGGSALAAGSTAVAATAQSSARVSGSALASGSSLVASKADVFSKSASRSLGTGFATASTKSAALATTTGRAVSHGLSVVGEKASAVVAATKKGFSSGYAWTKTQGLKLAPTVSERVAKVGRQVQGYTRAGVAHAKGGFEKAKTLMPKTLVPKALALTRGKASATVAEVPAAGFLALDEEVYGPFDEGFMVEGPSLNDPDAFVTEDVAPRVRRENALSSRARELTQDLRARVTRVRDAWGEHPFVQTVRARTRDVELSQMMIIVGAVLLVCGGLLLGGGFIMRAGAVPGVGSGSSARTVVPEEVAEEEIHGVAWTFEDYDSPFADRSVFTLAGTPESFGINGLSISGFNESGQPLTDVHAILKPDVQRPDLKLILQVDDSADADDSGAQTLDIVSANTIPAHAPFRLVFPFPPEAMDGEDGVAVEEFFDSYGGLLLKFRYEIDGAQKSIIQYLPSELLRSQLDEVEAEASGS